MDHYCFIIPGSSGRIVVWASVAAVCFLLFLLLFICLFWICAKHSMSQESVCVWVNLGGEYGAWWVLRLIFAFL